MYQAYPRHSVTPERVLGPPCMSRIVLALYLLLYPNLSMYIYLHLPVDIPDIDPMSMFIQYNIQL